MGKAQSRKIKLQVWEREKWAILPLKLVSLSLFFVCLPDAAEKVGSNCRSPIPRPPSHFITMPARILNTAASAPSLAKLDSAIRYKPEYATFHQVKGWVYEQLQKPDSAIMAYETCLRYDSNYPEVWLRLGTLYLEAENYDAGSRYLRRAVQEYPDSSRINLDLGRAYYYLDRPGLALSYLKSYDRQVKDTPAAYLKWLGLVSYQQKNYQEASDALTQFVAMEKEDAVAWKYLGLAQFELEKYDQSISSFNASGNLDPGDSDLYVYRSRYFRVFSKDDIALEQLRVGLEYDSTNVNILFELAVHFYDAGEFARAQNYADQVVEQDESYWLAYRYLGFLAEKNDNPFLARQYYQRYLENTFEQDLEVQERIKNLQNTPPNN